MGNSPSAIPQQSWSKACGYAFTSQNLTLGLVDQNGNLMSSLTNYTWGITQAACHAVCGRDKMYQVYMYELQNILNFADALRYCCQEFDFTNFSTSLTNWLLPWLALSAQLPYEASGTGSNIMSGLLAIGSPALISYSLSLTILNRSWVRRKFVKFKKDSHGIKGRAPYINDRISAAGRLLCDAQQAPIRVSQQDGWLSSLIVLEGNQPFWEAVKKDLRNTRRGFTASLFAQSKFLVITDSSGMTNVNRSLHGICRLFVHHNQRF